MERVMELLPCPFCGGKEIGLYGIQSTGEFMHARCKKCKAQASPKVWNKRKAPKPEGGLDENEAMRKVRDREARQRVRSQPCDPRQLELLVP